MFYHQVHLKKEKKEKKDPDFWIDIPNYWYETWLCLWLESISINYKN